MVNGNRILEGRRKDGKLVRISSKQVRRKAYHMDVFEDILDLAGRYDVDYVKGLTREEKIEFVETLPEELIYEFQDEIFRFLTSKDDDTKIVLGQIGPYKVDGDIIIKPKYKNGRNLVAFQDLMNSEFRTIVLLTPGQTIEMTKTFPFELFTKKK